MVCGITQIDLKKIFIHIVSLFLALGLVLDANASALNLTLEAFNVEELIDLSSEKESKKKADDFIKVKKRSLVKKSAPVLKDVTNCNHHVTERYFESHVVTAFLELHILHESFLL